MHIRNKYAALLCTTVFWITLGSGVASGKSIQATNCSKHAATNISSFTNSALYAYFQSEFSPKFRCSFYAGDKSVHKYLKFESKNNLEIKLSDVVTQEQRFSWMNITFLNNKKADINGAYRAIMKHFHYMGFTLDWNRYHSFHEGDEKVLIYCDSLYQTGALAVAHFRKDVLQSVQLGFLEKHICPKSLVDFNNMFSKKK